MRYNILFLALLLVVLGAAGLVLAQEAIPVPAVYSVIFAASMVQAIGAVIGFTQLINNVAKLHGWAAVALAFFTSIGYAFAMYLPNGVLFCLAVGIAAFIPAALAYKATKVAGAARTQ